MAKRIVWISVVIVSLVTQIAPFPASAVVSPAQYAHESALQPSNSPTPLLQADVQVSPAQPVTLVGVPVTIVETIRNPGASPASFNVVLNQPDGTTSTYTPSIGGGQSINYSLVITPPVAGQSSFTATATNVTAGSSTTKKGFLVAYNAYTDLLSVSGLPEYVDSITPTTTLYATIFNRTPVLQPVSIWITVSTPSAAVYYAQQITGSVPTGISYVVLGTPSFAGAAPGDYPMLAQFSAGPPVAASIEVSTAFKGDISAGPNTYGIITPSIKAPAQGNPTPLLIAPGLVTATTTITTQRMPITTPPFSGVVVTVNLDISNMGNISSVGKNVFLPSGTYSVEIISGSVRPAGSAYWYSGIIAANTNNNKEYVLGWDRPYFEQGAPTRQQAADAYAGTWTTLRVSNPATISLYIYDYPCPQVYCPLAYVPAPLSPASAAAGGVAGAAQATPPRADPFCQAHPQHCQAAGPDISAAVSRQPVPANASSPENVQPPAPVAATASPPMPHAAPVAVAPAAPAAIVVTMVNTLIDDVTGLPVPNTSGYAYVYSGTSYINYYYVTTDASGVYTFTSTSILTGNISLWHYGFTGYLNQYTDRVMSLGNATGLPTVAGVNANTIRLIPQTRLITTLTDSYTGLPVAHASGYVYVYTGTTQLDYEYFTTDATGVYTVSLTASALISGPVFLKHTGMAAYATQYNDRAATLAGATPVNVRSGASSLAVKLLPGDQVAVTLTDNRTGLPVANTPMYLYAYYASTYDYNAGATDASGIVTVTFTTFMTQPVQLKFGSMTAYPDQFYDRTALQAQALTVTLQPGPTSLAARLIPRTTLTVTLLDNDTQQPIANAAGYVYVISGTQLDYKYLSTNASGVYVASFTPIISQPVYLQHQSWPNYANQYFDRVPNVISATQVSLVSGPNVMTISLVSAVKFIHTLIDDATSQPISNTSLYVDAYNGTQSIPNTQQYVTTDANGVYTATESALSNQTVRLHFQYLTKYIDQFYDRKVSAATANDVPVTLGANQLTVRMIPKTTLVDTLLDSTTGQPIPNKSGYVYAYSGTNQLDYGFFSSDASGVFTVSFSAYISQPVSLLYNNMSYSAPYYVDQYYDQSPNLAGSQQVILKSGINRLTTHLIPTVQLVTTLIDDQTGLPITNTSGIVGIYSPTTGLNLAGNTINTDIYGVYTTSFNLVISQSLVVLHSGFTNYGNQYFDRSNVMGGAQPLPVTNGINRRTMRLAQKTVLGIQFLNDRTGQAVTDAFGSLEVFSGAQSIDLEGFNSSAGGLYTVTFATILSQALVLKFEYMLNYTTQYYQYTSDPTAAQPVFLKPGTSTLVMHIVPKAVLVNQLIDDDTSLPITGMNVHVQVFSNTQFIATCDGTAYSCTTDNRGIYTTTLSAAGIVSGFYQIAHVSFPGNAYPDQYVDRTNLITTAQVLNLRGGINQNSFRISEQTSVIVKLVDAVTHQPISNTYGFVSYDTPVRFFTRVELPFYTYYYQGWFTTDQNGVYTPTLSAPLWSNTPFYMHYSSVTGYLEQFTTLASVRENASALTMRGGRNYITVTLGPIRQSQGSITVRLTQMAPVTNALTSRTEAAINHASMRATADAAEWTAPTWDGIYLDPHLVYGAHFPCNGCHVQGQALAGLAMAQEKMPRSAIKPDIINWLSDFLYNVQCPANGQCAGSGKAGALVDYQCCAPNEIRQESALGVWGWAEMGEAERLASHPTLTTTTRLQALVDFLLTQRTPYNLWIDSKDFMSDIPPMAWWGTYDYRCGDTSMPYSPLYVYNVMTGLREIYERTHDPKYAAAMQQAIDSLLLTDWRDTCNGERYPGLTAMNMLSLLEAKPYISDPVRLDLIQHNIVSYELDLRTTQQVYTLTTFNDGGWRWTSLNLSTATSENDTTAIATYALVKEGVDPRDTAVISSAQFLLNTQDYTGRWYPPNGGSPTMATTWVEFALPLIYETINAQILDIKHTTPDSLYIIPGSASLKPTALYTDSNGNEELWRYSAKRDYEQRVINITSVAPMVAPGEIAQLSRGTVVTYTADWASGQATLPAVFVQAAKLGVIAPHVQAIGTGQTAHFTITVQNPYPVATSFIVSLIGLEPYGVAPSWRFYLAPQATIQRAVDVQIPVGIAPRSDGVWLRTTANGQADLDTARLDVSGGFVLALAPAVTVATPAQIVTYTVTLTDTSGFTNTVNVVGADANGLAAVLGTGLTLPPLGSAVIAWPAAAPFGAGSYAIVVTATNASNTIAQSGQLTVNQGATISASLTGGVTGPGMPVALQGVISQAGFGLPGAALTLTAPAGWDASFTTEQLAPGLGALSITAVLTPPMGTPATDYPVSLAAVTTGYPGLAAAGNAVVTVSSQSFQATVNPPAQSVGQYQTYTLTVHITNTGALPDIYALAPAGNVVLQQQGNAASSAIQPGQGRDVLFAGTASGALNPGPNTVVMTVTSGFDNRIQRAVNAQVTVIARSVAVNAAAPGNLLSTFDPFTVTARVTNTGQLSETFAVQPGGALAGLLSPATAYVALAPGATTNAAFSGAVPLGLAGGTYQVAIAASAASDGLVTGTASAPVSIVQTRGVSGVLSPPTQTLTAPGWFTYTLSITDAGTLSDSYTVTGAGGLPVALSNASNPVALNGLGQTAVLVSGHMSSTVAGAYPVIVELQSTIDSRVIAIVTAQLIVPTGAFTPTHFVFVPISFR